MKNMLTIAGAAPAGYRMKLPILAAAVLAFGVPAEAAVVDTFAVTGSTSTLTLDAVVPGGNQPKNNPCLICGTTQPAQPDGFGYNNFDATGNVSDYLMFSTAEVGGSLAQDTLGTGYDVRPDRSCASTCCRSCRGRPSTSASTSTRPTRRRRWRASTS